MPRYIDADALVRRLKHSPLFLGTQMQFKDGVIDLVEKQPTADVVPREEFEFLQRRYDLAVAEREANAKARIDANIELDAMRGASNSLKMHYDKQYKQIDELMEDVARLSILNLEIEKETVRKMQNRLNTVFYSESKYMTQTHGYIRYIVDEISKEMLEESNG